MNVSGIDTLSASVAVILYGAVSINVIYKIYINSVISHINYER